MSKHLHERGSSFQYRRVFPQDVRTTAGRRELTRSLKVKTKKEAEIEAALLDVEFNKIVATARGTGQPNEATAIVLATRLLQSKGLLTSEGAVNFPQIDPRKPEHSTIEKQLRVIKGVIEHPAILFDTLPMLRDYLSSLKSRDPADPVFPRYSKPKGNTNLTSAFGRLWTGAIWISWRTDFGNNLKLSCVRDVSVALKRSVLAVWRDDFPLSAHSSMELHDRTI